MSALNIFKYAKAFLYLHIIIIIIVIINKGSRRHSQTFLTLNRHLLTPSFLPESLLTSLDNSNVLRLSNECLGAVKAIPGGLGRVFGVPVGVLECSRVFWSVGWCCVLSNVSLNGLPERMHNYTGCICLTFPCCVFANVSSNGLPNRMHSHTGCICMNIFRCVF